MASPKSNWDKNELNTSRLQEATVILVYTENVHLSFVIKHDV